MGIHREPCRVFRLESIGSVDAPMACSMGDER